MLNFELLKPLAQPNWALTPFLDTPPAIEAFRKCRANFLPEVMENGVYRITASEFAVQARGDDLLIWRDPDFWAWNQLTDTQKRQPGARGPWKSDVRMTVRSSNYVWVESIKRRTISYNSGIFQLLGVFEKTGSVVHFNTLNAETLAYV